MALNSGSLDWTASTVGTLPKATLPGTNPVLLVHGLAATKSCWLHLTRVLRDKGTAVATMSFLFTCPP